MTQPIPRATVLTSQNSAQNTTPALVAEQIIAKQDALERLKYWWQQADAEQREAFVSQSVATGSDQVKSVAVVNALDSLKFWWKLADEKQRNNFKVWIET